jgi:hypothetical protein
MTAPSAAVCEAELPSGTVLRISRHGRRYISEVVRLRDDAVLGSRPISIAEAEEAAGGPLIASEAAEASERETAGRALLQLLTARPNTWTSSADVIDLLGRSVSEQAVSNAAGRLRRGRLGLAIVGRPGRGYMLLVPEQSSGPERCEVCRLMSPLETCCHEAMRGRPVEPGQWCGGWEA